MGKNGYYFAKNNIFTDPSNVYDNAAYPLVILRFSLIK